MGRKQASTDDATAERFLANGWEALRERMGYGDEVPPGSLSDIPVLAGIGPTLAVGDDTTGAFYRRWPNREAYLADLLEYALAQTRRGDASEERTTRLIEALRDRPPLSELVRIAATAEMEDHYEDPWFGLQLRLWPDARHEESVRDRLRTTYEAAADAWETAYDLVVGMYRVTLRPEATTRQMAILLNALVDGMTIRKVISPESVDDGLLPFGIEAMILGVLEATADTTGMTVAEAVDAIARAE